jgi:DNA-directed RNA polymerase specialized sigma subunit
MAGHYASLLLHPAMCDQTVLRTAREELLEMVMPFVRHEYQRRARDLPPHADVHALEEAMLDAAMRACLSFDPHTFISWPALLKAKLTMAPTEAARVDSKISRRHAKFSSAFRIAEEHRVQQLGRSLTPEERREIAEEVAPDTRREKWSSVVQQNLRIVQIDALPDEGRSFEDMGSIDTAHDNLTNEELRQELAETLASLPAETRRLFTEELARVSEGKEPRKSVLMRLKKQIPQHLRIYLS